MAEVLTFKLGDFSAAVSKASLVSCTRCCHISPLPYLSICTWSLGRNSVLPCRAAMKCPVTTRNTAQLRYTVCVGSGMTIPACLAKNPMILLTGMGSDSLRKSTRSNYSHITFLTLWKFFPGPGWCTARRPTPVRGTSVGQRKWPAGDFAPPELEC